jgi:predicted nucleic acid-binding Zn ribbon protein
MAIIKEKRKFNYIMMVVFIVIAVGMVYFRFF